ncbi:MAG TPA: DUF559 domain-containing protein [Actinomycetota bacterium]|nr:DUF559 domain-containing protein [Actinomycetota bacterium]
MSDELLETAIEDALRRQLTSPQRVVQRLLDMPPNLPGRSRLRRALESRGGQAPTESALEVKLVRLLRSEGFPPAIRQKVLDDDGRFVGRVDFVYPDRRLIIEVEGFRFHSGRRSFDADRVRRNSLTAMGWMLLQATAPMLRPPGQEDFVRDLRRAYGRPL